MTARWGILATGRIAHALARAILGSDSSKLVAVGSRTAEAAQEFCDSYERTAPDIAAHGSYQALLEDDNVDVVYVATPHPQHVEWTIKALEHGKAVLCEKPMGVNHPQVMAMVETAHREQRFLMEAFMYRAHPQTRKLVELIRDGAIGEVRQVNASFGFAAPFDPAGRLYNNDLAGGGIMDVGCYPVSMARLIADAEPEAVTGLADLAETGVDRSASALLRFPDGLIARVSTAVGVALDNRVQLFGTKGRIEVRRPWLAADKEWRFEMVRDGKRERMSGKTRPLYQLEVDAVAAAVAEGRLECPAMDWQDSLGNALTLDRWRQSAGVVFDLEGAERQTRPLRGEPLTTRRPVMRHARIDGVDKPVSKLVMGCDNQPNIAHAAAMFDHYFEHGGNTFDTAYIYGGGRMEEQLGAWLASRGVREQAVVIGKGAHTPANFPDRVAPQLTETLERLGTDYVDVYFLHRDNDQVPVDEWLDVLDGERAAGRVRAYGVSNWRLGRVQAANAYAQESGRVPLAAVSNNFSLARMVDPVWPGCVAASTSDWRQWLAEEQMPLFPWSSQARGFFTPRADAVRAGASSQSALGSVGNAPSDAELRRCWFADDNFERRERAGRLAERLDVSLIHVALAYVLRQPFPCFALIGPRTLQETRSSLAALDVELGVDELAWLDEG